MIAMQVRLQQDVPRLLYIRLTPRPTATQIAMRRVWTLKRRRTTGGRSRLGVRKQDDTTNIAYGVAGTFRKISLDELGKLDRRSYLSGDNMHSSSLDFSDGNF